MRLVLPHQCDVAIKALVAHRFIGRQQTQREGSIVDAAEHFVERAIHVRTVTDGFFEGVDQSLEVPRDGGEFLRIALAASVKVVGGAGEVRGGE